MKLFFAFGTRPETIKMAPLIHEAKKRGHQAIVGLSGQHREMVAPFLKWFDLQVDYDLEIMRPNQTLTEITMYALEGYSRVLAECKPDIVFVQGDTTTSFVAALAAFYQGIKVAHVEAGLRTGNKLSPFPEEINRSLIGRIADYHFPPTIKSAENLKAEGLSENISVTGNTSIDALEYTLKKLSTQEQAKAQPYLEHDGRLVLVTTHRRENLGDGHREIFQAIKTLVQEFNDLKVIFPVHLNPRVREIVAQELDGLDRIHLCDPLDYTDFVGAMKKTTLILTDSGGVQEEAPHLGVPVLVLRNTTERPESVEAGCSFLVGTSKEAILKQARQLLTDPVHYAKVSKTANPYGDGTASLKILDFIER
jgi:UDP-N-acetylglucosamine 2-epimerase (non-hydrolysing)